MQRIHAKPQGEQGRVERSGMAIEPPSFSGLSGLSFLVSALVTIARKVGDGKFRRSDFEVGDFAATVSSDDVLVVNLGIDLAVLDSCDEHVTGVLADLVVGVRLEEIP